MTTQNSERLARFGKTLDIIAKVLVVFCILGAVFALFGAIAVAIVPDSLISSALVQIPLTSSVFSWAPGTTVGDFILPAAISGVKTLSIVALAAFCAYCLLSALILFILSSVFRATAVNKSPFLEENVRRLKIIGIILIVASLAFGLTNLVIAFAVLALAYVFQYGTELQRAADETL